MSVIIAPPLCGARASAPHVMMAPMMPDLLMRSVNMMPLRACPSPFVRGTMSIPLPQKVRQDMPPRHSLASAKVPLIRGISATAPMAPLHAQWPASNQLPRPALTPRTPSGPLEIDELYSDDILFDPSTEPARGQLMSKMRLPPSAQIGTLRGGIGSCNAGMWELRDGCQSFVLKLVRSSAGPVPGQASQVDKFAKLCRDFPGITADPSLAFPCKIFSVISAAGKSHDLVVMRQVPGQRVSDVIMQKLHGRQDQELMRILEQFGGFLADFHARYSGMQHGDLTPANVFYDQASRRFTLVDVADLAPRNPVIQADAERFSSSLKLLSHFYGPDFYMEGKARFEAAYNASRSRRNF